MVQAYMHIIEKLKVLGIEGFGFENADALEDVLDNFGCQFTEGMAIHPSFLLRLLRRVGSDVANDEVRLPVDFAEIGARKTLICHRTQLTTQKIGRELAIRKSSRTR